MNDLPSPRDLRVFGAVVRNGSFAATAVELGASPAFVSKRIAALEAALRVRLLHRTTRRVSVTEDGATVDQWAQKVLEDLEQMEDALTSAKTTPRGRLHVSATVGLGRRRIAPALSALVRRHPSLQVQLELLDRSVDVVREGFDLDIRVGGRVEPNLMARRIASNCRVLCAAPAYLARHGVPRRLSDLKSHQCIAIRERDQPVGLWRLKGPRGSESVKVSGPLSANNGEVVHQWAIDGQGIILRSIWDVGASLEAGTLRRVLPQYLQEAHISAVYPTRLSASAKVRVCVQFLEQWLAASPPAGA